MTRNAALDVLKVSLALMVVGLHSGFLSEINSFASYLMTNGLFRIAVPVFLLINGYFFYRELAKGVPSRWFKRVGLLYAVWMAVYLPFWLPGLEHGVARFALKSFQTIFFGCYQLWYLAGMIGAALMIAALRKTGTAFCGIAMALTFAAGVAIQYNGNYQWAGNGLALKLSTLTWSHRNFALFSFPFFCAGYLISKHSLERFFTIRSAGLACAVGTALLFVESSHNFSRLGEGAAFDNLASLAFFCPSLFLLFMKLDIKSHSKELAEYSTGIYLVHVLIISITLKLVAISPTALTAWTAAASVLASYFLIRLNRKLPFIL